MVAVEVSENPCHGQDGRGSVLPAEDGVSCALDGHARVSGDELSEKPNDVERATSKKPHDVTIKLPIFSHLQAISSS